MSMLPESGLTAVGARLLQCKSSKSAQVLSGGRLSLQRPKSGALRPLLAHDSSRRSQSGLSTALARLMRA
eukprot:366365-Chlamydomonas_euryale.AAC.1